MVRSAWLAVAVVAGCARYVPAPIDLGARPATYRARRLDDSALISWVSRWAGAPADRRWTDRQLAVAALGLRADVARARADWRAAAAGERSAGARPAPGAQAGVERAVSGSDGQSPWVVSLGSLFAVELGGKRGARVQRARARTGLAESELRLAAWRAVRETRAGVAELMTADLEVDGARREVEALTAVETLERARVREASLSSAELARASSEVQAARVQAAAAEAARLAAQAALAAALAVPTTSLDSLSIRPDEAPGCAPAESASGQPAAGPAERALGRRPELGQALADYAGAEADVRLEVARLSPDLELGPGFIWDQGVHRWTLALALPNLLAFRNHAALEEAEARRRASAARVAETQEAVLADVERAVARCRGARLERAAADTQVAAAAHAAALADSAYARGETSRLDPALAALGLVRAERARNGAERRVVAAGLALEAATGEWAGDGNRWPDPREDGPMEGAPR